MQTVPVVHRLLFRLDLCDYQIDDRLPLRTAEPFHRTAERFQCCRPLSLWWRPEIDVVSFSVVARRLNETLSTRSTASFSTARAARSPQSLHIGSHGLERIKQMKGCPTSPCRLRLSLKTRRCKILLSYDGSGNSSESHICILPPHFPLELEYVAHPEQTPTNAAL